MNKCLSCMEDITPGAKQCPHCGYNGDTSPEKEYFLPPGTIVRGEYLCGTVMEEKEDCIEYIGYDFSRDCKVIIKEFFPLDFLCRGAEDDVAEIREGFIEEYEQQLGDFAKKYRSLAEDDKAQAKAVHKCFLENNTCYVIKAYDETPKRKKTSFEKPEKEKSGTIRQSGGKSKIVAMAVILCCVLVLSFVFIATKLNNTRNNMNSELEAVYVSTDGENYFELQFNQEKDFLIFNSGHFTANMLDRDVIGDADELYVRTESPKNCRVTIIGSEGEVHPTDDGVYTVPLEDEGSVNIVSENEKSIASVRANTNYTFSYERKLYTKLTGIGYVLNDDANQLNIPDFNPEVYDYVIELTNKTKLIHINSLLTDDDTECEIVFVGSEQFESNKDANKTGKLQITPMDKPHEIYVEIKLSDKSGRKEDVTYHLTLKVPEKEKPAGKPQPKKTQPSKVQPKKSYNSGTGNSSTYTPPVSIPKTDDGPLHLY